MDLVLRLAASVLMLGHTAYVKVRCLLTGESWRPATGFEKRL